MHKLFSRKISRTFPGSVEKMQYSISIDLLFIVVSLPLVNEESLIGLSLPGPDHTSPKRRLNRSTIWSLVNHGIQAIISVSILRLRPCQSIVLKSRIVSNDEVINLFLLSGLFSSIPIVKRYADHDVLPLELATMQKSILVVFNINIRVSLPHINTGLLQSLTILFSLQNSNQTSS